MSKCVCIGIVSPWPTVRNAEYEIIERMKIAINKLGHHWIIVDGCGSTLDSSNPEFKDVSDVAEFCISMHFVSPKLWEPYTYLALWNPPRYYHDSNYQEVMTHVGSYDDYLVYDSDSIKNHILNFLRGTKKDLDGAVEFFSGGAGEIFPVLDRLPTDCSLFYCGINWEKLAGRPGRHHDLLKMLDQDNIIKIFGPEKFEGVRPWAGFKNYQGSIPFDGVSIFEKLRKCGVALVLSSTDHVLAEAASNRVYEAINAGVVVLSDRNPFIVKEFGDTVFYFDYGHSWYETFSNIKTRFEWIRDHSVEALRSASRAQEIYKRKHTLEGSIQNLISKHPERFRLYKDKFYTADIGKIAILMPCNSRNFDSFVRQLISLNNQEYKNLFVMIAVEREMNQACTETVQKYLTNRAVSILPIDSTVPGFNLSKKTVGGFCAELLSQVPNETVAFCVMDEGEIWHSNHICTLARQLQDDSSKHIAVSGSYSYSKIQSSKQLLHYVFDRDHLSVVIGKRPHLLKYSALFQYDGTVNNKDFIRILSMLDSRVKDLFLVHLMKSYGAFSIGSSGIISSYFEDDPISETKLTRLMSSNYLTDYYRNDLGYQNLVSIFGNNDSSIVGKDLLMSFIRGIRKRTEGKKYYSFLVWFYRRFLVKLVHR